MCGSSATFPAEAIRLRQSDRIGELTRRFLGFVKAGRDHLAARKARQMAMDETWNGELTLPQGSNLVKECR